MDLIKYTEGDNMNREIKFRVWDPKSSSWLWVPDELGNMICCSDWDMFNPDDYQFEQFTGLKDKSGKDIYENDLLKFKLPFDKNSTIGQVEWSDKILIYLIALPLFLCSNLTTFFVHLDCKHFVGCDSLKL